MSHRHLVRLVALWLITLFMACAPVTPTPAPQPTPAAVTLAQASGEWVVSTAEAQGMDATKLAGLTAAIEAQSLDVHGVVVVRNGQIVLESYYGSFTQNTRQEIYSCTKSFASTLVGIARERGLITDLRAPVLDLLPGRYANIEASKRAMTLEDVLTMRTGLDWTEGDLAYRELFTSRDWPRYVLNSKMVAEPGSTFNYCTGCSHLLTSIVARAVKGNMLTFAQDNLLKPIGITEAEWILDPAKVPNGGWGLSLTPREMARFGQLFLNRGEWAGRQVISAEWVELATTQHVNLGAEPGYGYQWWTYPSLEAYAAQGRGGQLIFVQPKNQLVVVFTSGDEDNGRLVGLIQEHVLPAIQGK